MITELISDYGFPIVATVGMGYFVYYNNGAVHKLSGNSINIVQPPNSIEQVMDDYRRAMHDSK